VNPPLSAAATSPLQARFAAAAEVLAGNTDGQAGGSGELLEFLGYDDGQAARTAGRVRMLRAAAKLRRMFQFPIPDAPGLVFFGGEADPALLDADLTGLPAGSLAGSGRSPQRAFESCVGEGIEYLSQFARADDPLSFAPPAEAADGKDAIARHFIATVVGKRQVDWIATRQLSDDAAAWFPVDLCLRRSAARQTVPPPGKLSTGCAAGATSAAAALRAVLELIERDAVALWWRGGRRGRPIAASSSAGAKATELLAALRQGNDARHTWLLDITSDVAVPAVVAVSANADGHGCAVGFAARLTLADAASAAIFEMCQSELGLHIVAAKRAEAGDHALNDNDHRILRRGTTLDTRSCAMLQPAGMPAPERPAIADEPAGALHALTGRLDRMGIATYLLDLTRSDFAVPVVRVLAPQLQLEPCEIIGDRLARAIAETGGGGVHGATVALL